MFDIMAEIDAIRRSVRREGTGDDETVTVVVSRTYPTGAEDVWDAIASPDRIRRWFAPVTGDLKEGGNFQIEGNASGQILKCDKPHLLRTTFGDVTSILEVRLVPAADDTETTLEVEHTVPIAMAQSGAGALWVGPGWDGALLGLGLHVAGNSPEDPAEAAASPEVQRFSAASAQAWADNVRESGTATEEEVAGALAVALGQYSPDV